MKCQARTSARTPLSSIVRLHMHLRVVAAVVVLCLFGSDVFACTCIAPVKGHEADWAKERLEYADVVVLARVVSVSGEYPKSAVVEVQETVKGLAGRSRTMRESHCPGYRPKVGDTRVFFLGADGRIVACSTYDDVISTDDLVALLRSLRSNSAT
jgi:hypothetical protein